MTLSKQQPDNPILKFLQKDLANTIEPVLPGILSGMANSQPSEPVVEQTNHKGFNEPALAAKKQVSSLDKFSNSRYINRLEI